MLPRKRVLLGTGWALAAGLRIWLSHRQAVPLANPDESAYLITARMLAGGPSTDFSAGTLYPVGYPLLILPVFWFTSSPALVYHAVLVINALVSALVVPLGYVACLRLGLSWRLSFAVAMVTGLLPAALFYSQYAMADAVFPVVVLAWLLATHTWLSARGRAAYGWGAGSALLAGYAFAVHARGLVVVVCYALLGSLVFVRRMVPRASVAVATLLLAVACASATMLNRHVSAVLYSRGARSLSGQALSRLHSVRGVTLIVEMAGGQMWRLFLDSWGIAGVGLAAALVVMLRRDIVPRDTRLMACVAIAVTLGIALSSPAALPADQQQTWASGRYLDCMIVVFFLAGATALLRCAPRQVLILAAAVLPVVVLTAAFVVGYAGSRLPIGSFGPAFNFAVPALLTKDWAEPSVPLATMVVGGLLVLWAVITAVPWRRLRRLRAPALLAGLALVSLVAASEMTEQVSYAYTAPAKSNATGLTATGSLKPGEQIAIGITVGWTTWVPQAYQIWWTSPQFFDPSQGAPPAGVTVVELPMPAATPAASFTSVSGSGSASSSGSATTSGATSSGSAATGPAVTGPAASWPNAPAGWYVAAVNVTAGWVVWRATG
ncbi:MAG TPA: hypothetical protein VKU39_12490 [Streptosporangiaceae bacterium]|nr:hypothetical protein [Streptosporangiaceae bacterium]